MRCVVAIAYGTYLGTSGATSPTVIIQAFNLLAFVPIMYCRLYLGINAEAFGGPICEQSIGRQDVKHEFVKEFRPLSFTALALSQATFNYAISCHPKAKESFLWALILASLE